MCVSKGLNVWMIQTERNVLSDLGLRIQRFQTLKLTPLDEGEMVRELSEEKKGGIR